MRKIHALYESGTVIAGTSAGASVVCSTMLTSGAGDESYRAGEGVTIAPGLGLIGGVVIDQHFAERGRFGRLLGAVAQNPASLGAMIAAASPERHQPCLSANSKNVRRTDAHLLVVRAYPSSRTFLARS